LVLLRIAATPTLMWRSPARRRVSRPETPLLESCPNYLLEIYYFYISQTKSSLDKIFYVVVYHHIIYICDFFVNLDDFFPMVCTGFHEGCGFHLIRCHLSYPFSNTSMSFKNPSTMENPKK
jgi:hypothetical protein